jgi:hypothetical protein
MATIHVFAERTVDASTETVYGYLADMREHHPRFLPPAFSEFEGSMPGVQRPAFEAVARVRAQGLLAWIHSQSRHWPRVRRAAVCRSR